ncbi:MAG: HD-GYP domain-containing protein, partial [Deltaproteobacteria bacterium]
HLLSICSQAQALGRQRLVQSPASLPGEVIAEARKAVYSLARAVDARDSYTYSHSGRVAMVAEALGRKLGLSERELDAIRTGGLLHDIGKIGVPDHVLKKPGPLSEEEKDIIRKHPLIGIEILGPLELEPEVYKIVSQHHENVDGSGYPFSLADDRIHPLARIVRVADAYEAMASDRVYRSARRSHWIRQEFEKYSDSQFDPVVSKTMLTLLDSNDLQAFVT